MTEEQDRARDGFREGVRTVTGVLGALVEALEQTFTDLRDNDLAPDRAREMARSAVQRAQETVEDLRGRLEFVPRREFDSLRAEVAALRARVDELQAAATPTAATPADTTTPPDFPIDGG
jgi:hypothetical protein